MADVLDGAVAAERDRSAKPLVEGLVAGRQASHALGALDRPRRDRVAADPEAAPLEREIAHEVVDAGLGGPHVGLQRVRNVGLSGGDEEDRAPRLPKLRERGAAGIERAQEVDVHNRLEAAGAELLGRAGEVPRGAAHQVFDRAERVPGRVEGLRQGVVVAYIGDLRRHPRAEPFELPRRALEPLARAAADADIRAEGREARRDAEVDAAAAAGDEHDLAREQVARQDSTKIHRFHLS